MTREIPHGTSSGYKYHRCHCDKCRAWKREYERERGDNRRVGKRAEQKRQADLNLRHPCEACGALCTRQARVCDVCQRAVVRAAVNERRAGIQRRWLAGESYRQIAVAIGTTPGSIQVELVRMRRAGWVMPKRGPRGRALA